MENINVIEIENAKTWEKTKNLMCLRNQINAVLSYRVNSCRNGMGAADVRYREVPAKLLSGLQTGNNRDWDYERKVRSKLEGLASVFENAKREYDRDEVRYLYPRKDTSYTPNEWTIDALRLFDHQRLRSFLLDSMPRRKEAASFMSVSLGFKNSATVVKRSTSVGCCTLRSTYRGHMHMRCLSS